MMQTFLFTYIAASLLAYFYLVIKQGVRRSVPALPFLAALLWIIVVDRLTHSGTLEGFQNFVPYSIVGMILLWSIHCILRVLIWKR